MRNLKKTTKHQLNTSSNGYDRILHLILSKKSKTLIMHAWIAATLAVTSSSTFAATIDGVVGATSTTTVDTFLAIGDVIRISGLSDFDFGNWSGAGDLDDTQDIRINVNYGTNDATRRFEVTAVGDHNSGNFLLENSAAKLYLFKPGSMTRQATQAKCPLFLEQLWLDKQVRGFPCEQQRGERA